MNLTSNQIIRNIKLHLLSDIKLDSDVQMIYNKLLKYFSNLNVYMEDVYEESLIFHYYGTDINNLHIRYNLNRSIICIDVNIWNFFLKHDTSHTDTEELISWYIGNVFNINMSMYHIDKMYLSYVDTSNLQQI